MKLSATRLKTYLTCPRQYRYAYVEEIPAVPTAPLLFGRVLHECLRFAHDERLWTGMLPQAEVLLEQFDLLWSRALHAEQPYCSEGEKALQGYAKNGREMLRLFLRGTNAMPAPLVAEFPFEVQVGEHTLCGIIDVVTEGEAGLVITDYKSGKRKLNAQELERDLQLTVYAFAARQVFERPVEKVMHIYLRDGSRSESERDEGDFAWLLYEVLPYVAQNIQAEHLGPTPGLHYRWCDYRELCAAEGIDPQDSGAALAATAAGGEDLWLMPQS